MAGDIGVRESVVILGAEEGDRFEESFGPVLADAGVLHRYGSRVVVGEIPEGAPAVLAEAAPLATVRDESEAPPPADLDLDPVESIGLSAFALRQSEAYASAKASRPRAGAAWDDPEATIPDAPADSSADLGAPPAPSSALSQRLIGEVAVGLVIVSGPTPDLQFTEAEVVEIVAEVQNGLGWLGSRSVAGGVAWYYDVQTVSIPTPADPQSPDLEGHWRNPAMEAVGFVGGFTAVEDYVASIRARLRTRWSFCAFFTKYPVAHFAYALAPRIVMQAPYDNWGPTNIDRVFAHETGHVFGAPDEYAESNCNCGGSFGFFGRPNANCVNCAPGGGVECLMSRNSWAMCGWTPWHLGFYWPPGRELSAGEATTVAPAAVAFKGKLNLFWKGNDAAGSILHSTSADGIAWSAGRRVDEVGGTAGTPAAAEFSGALVLFWRANDSSNAILYAPSPGGTSWPAGKPINPTDASPSAPAAATFKGKLHVFWRANDSSDSILHSASAGGAPWPAGKRINATDSTRSAPAAVVFAGKLYVFWRATDEASSILYSASSDGVSWPLGRKINIVDATPSALAAAVFDDKLYLFWRAMEESNLILSSASRDGISWPPGQPINEVDRTMEAPAAAPLAGRLSLAWSAQSNARIHSSVLEV